MQVFVNQKEVQTIAENLSSLLSQLNLPQVGIAAAVNNKMIPRTDWDTCVLHNGAQITIIKAVCGG